MPKNREKMGESRLPAFMPIFHKPAIFKGYSFLQDGQASQTQCYNIGILEKLITHQLIEERGNEIEDSGSSLKVR